MTRSILIVNNSVDMDDVGSLESGDALLVVDGTEPGTVCAKNNALRAPNFESVFDQITGSGEFEADYQVADIGGTFGAVDGSPIELPNWESASGQDRNSRQANPGFLDAAAGDFGTASSSPSRDAGAAEPAAWLDYRGVEREGLFDVGAAEGGWDTVRSKDLYHEMSDTRTQAAKAAIWGTAPASVTLAGLTAGNSGTVVAAQSMKSIHWHAAVLSADVDCVVALGSETAGGVLTTHMQLHLKAGQAVTVPHAEVAWGSTDSGDELALEVVSGGPANVVASVRYWVG